MSDREALQRRLLVTFAGELGDAVRLLNEGLVRLADDVTASGEELVRELFRVAHGLKGAAHSAGVEDAVGAASRLEEALAAIRDGALVDPGRTAGMLADVDELARVYSTLTRRGGSPSTDDAVAATTFRAVAAPSAGTMAVQKLDQLVRHSGDLVTVANRIGSLASELGAVAESGAARPDRRASAETAARTVAEASRALTRLTTDIGNTTRALTFEPFAIACVGLDRVVHDIAVAAGKHADFHLAGGDVEVDRAVAAALREPLLHLVRNAIHHGIEPVAERRAAGKADRGSVMVAAALRAGAIEIEVADDGRGVDVAALRRAARERGMTDVADDADDAAVAFAPGVSTSGHVTEVSGRGVGLDAVRARIESMGGSVRLVSRSGESTTVTLVCPVSLARLAVLVVTAGTERWCVPMTNVTRVVRTRAEALQQVEGRTVLVAEGDTVPVVPLAVAVGVDTPWEVAGDTVRAVVVDNDGHPLALAVDRFDEATDVVVKTLPERVVALDTLLGAAALADGGMALVVNAAVCAKRARSRTAAAPVRAVPDAAPSVPRVILAEDNLTTRTLERTFLEAAGYEVVVASDGTEAWQLLQRHGAEIVVTDIDMPRTDGIELCRLIRESHRFARLPVVLVTSLASDEDRRRGLEAGADAYVVKAELQQESLLDLIGRLV